jgi:hypothetical protein
MVHIYCQNKDCRMLLHLDDSTYWNYKGKVKCERCNTEVDVEIKDGKAIYAKKKKN